MLGTRHRMQLFTHRPHLVSMLWLTKAGCPAASQDCTARVWDMEIGDCVLVMDGHSGPVTSIALAGNTLVTGSADKCARVWDMQRGTCLRLLRAHLGAVNDVAITPDARLAVTASSDGTARVWRLGSGDCCHVLGGSNHGGPLVHAWDPLGTWGLPDFCTAWPA